jgi:hydroxyacylglutathione hydrolase
LPIRYRFFHKKETLLSIIIQKIVLGPLENNSYIVIGDDLTCLIIDPAIGSKKIVDQLKKENLTPIAILLTHGHFDHIMGIPEILGAFPNIPVYASPLEMPLLTTPDYNGSPMLGKPYAISHEIVPLTNGTMTLGSFAFNVFPMPGHSPGGSAFLFDTSCFTGDSLFAGSIGRTDFPQCDHAALIAAIKTHLFSLPEETVVLSGHGGRTTIGREKRTNPFLV